jgi:CheY-like chemotaxis protein
VEDAVPEHLVGDPIRLGQVMINLVGNALKFTERGHVAVHVGTDAVTASEARLRVQVEDTGIGIPAHQAEAVFAAFVQADTSTTRRYGGTGLGLAIARRIIEAFGGRLWLESTPGVRTTFFFTASFGIAPAGAESAGTHATAAPPAGPVSPAGPGLRILVAEDNRVNQMLAVRLLEKVGHRVSVVGDGRAAVEAVARERFDLVLMDVQMPEMDGFEATAAIRAREARDPSGGRLPIIAVTAHALKGDAERCLASGMDGYVTKPMQPAELHAAIERLAVPA